MRELILPLALFPFSMRDGIDFRFQLGESCISFRLKGCLHHACLTILMTQPLPRKPHRVCESFSIINPALRISGAQNLLRGNGSGIKWK
jgi:hypothetical protein